VGELSLVWVQRAEGIHKIFLGYELNQGGGESGWAEVAAELVHFWICHAVEVTAEDEQCLRVVKGRVGGHLVGEVLEESFSFNAAVWGVSVDEEELLLVPGER